MMKYNNTTFALCVVCVVVVIAALAICDAPVKSAVAVLVVSACAAGVFASGAVCYKETRGGGYGIVLEEFDGKVYPILKSTTTEMVADVEGMMVNIGIKERANVVVLNSGSKTGVCVVAFQSMSMDPGDLKKYMNTDNKVLYFRPDDKKDPDAWTYQYVGMEGFMRKIIEKETKDMNVIMCGLSAGGYAALKMAHAFKCISITFNPNTMRMKDIVHIINNAVNTFPNEIDDISKLTNYHGSKHFVIVSSSNCSDKKSYGDLLYAGNIINNNNVHVSITPDTMHVMYNNITTKNLIKYVGDNFDAVFNDTEPDQLKRLLENITIHYNSGALMSPH